MNMKKNEIIPIYARVLQLAEDPLVLFKAKQIARNGVDASDKRTPKQREDDAVIGLAVEYAVGEYLRTLGYLVLSSVEWWYDLIVDGKLVDVKCRIGGRYFQQSGKEAEKITKEGLDVLYFCVDVVMPDNESTPPHFIFRGVCWSKNLTASMYDKPYVDRNSFSEMFDPS
jgi:hypothetical protein